MLFFSFFHSAEDPSQMNIVYKNLCVLQDDKGKKERPVCECGSEKLPSKSRQGSSSREGIQTLFVVLSIGSQVFGRKEKNVEMSWM